MVKLRPIDVTIDPAVRDLAQLIAAAFQGPETPASIVVEQQTVEGSVALDRAPLDDDTGCGVRVAVLQGQLLVGKTDGFSAFLQACGAEWASASYRVVMVVGTAATQAKLLDLAAATTMQPAPWSWCPAANLHEVAARIASIVTYLSKVNDTKVREAGYCMRKQRKCEATDFFALYRSMLSEIQGVSTRQVANMMSAAPTMDRLMELLATEGPDFPTLSRCNGYGEQREVGLGVAKLISQAMNAPLGTTAEAEGRTFIGTAETRAPPEPPQQPQQPREASPNDDWWLEA